MIRRTRIWWDSKTARDRVILAVAAIFVMVLLWMNFVTKPLADARVAAKARIAELETARLTLESLPADASNPVTGLDQPLRTLLADSARAAQLNIQSIDGTGDRLDVAFDAISFTNLVTWLDRLHRNHAVSVRAATLSRRAEPGLVSANLSLERAP